MLVSTQVKIGGWCRLVKLYSRVYAQVEVMLKNMNQLHNFVLVYIFRSLEDEFHHLKLIYNTILVCLSIQKQIINLKKGCGNLKSQDRPSDGR